MTLSKETLIKTQELLRSQITDLENQEYQIEAQLKDVTFKNFKVNGVEKRWNSGDKQSYRVAFKHISEDVDFYITNDENPINDVRWSSWSYSSIKPEEYIATIKKCKSYIEAVHEMLTILESPEQLEETVSKVIEIHSTQIAPLQNQRWDIMPQLREIDSAIVEIDNKEELQKALQLFAAPVYFAEPYRINKNNRVRSIKIEQKKDKYFAIIDDIRKKVSEHEIRDFYRHATKIVPSGNYEYDNEGNSIKKFYKTDNMFCDREQALNPVKTEITEEEFKAIRRY